MNPPKIDPHTCMYSMLFRINDEAPHTKGSEFLGASLDTKLRQTRTALQLLNQSKRLITG
jgi:hypothetical protein